MRTVNWQVGDKIIYSLQAKCRSSHYENGFVGEIVAIMDTKIRVRVKNKAGVEKLKDVKPSNLRRYHGPAVS